MRWHIYSSISVQCGRCLSFVLLVLILSALACTPSPVDSLSVSPSSTTDVVGGAETRPDGAVRLTTPPAGASDQNPAFAPDGSYILFTRFDNGYNNGPAGLFLLDVSTMTIARLTAWEDQDNVNMPGASWNPANHHIIFASDRLDAADLWRIDPDGTNFSRVTSHAGQDEYLEPTWSPDGQWIVFERSQAGASEDGRIGQIWKVRADGTDLIQLSGNGQSDDRQPNWSPAGDRIVFQRRTLPDGDWDIYTIAPDGSDLRNVTNSPNSSDTDATWSPDGTYIVYSSNFGRLSTPNIFIIAADGGAPMRVTRSATHEDSAPSWSPDGSRIAFESHIIADEQEGSAALWQINAPTALYLPLIVR